MSAGVIFLAAISRNLPPFSFPLEAARFPHIWIKTQSRMTTFPVAYIPPTRYWASAFPFSTSGLHSRRADAKFPLWYAVQPFWRSAPALFPKLPKKMVRVSQMMAGMVFIGMDLEKFLGEDRALGRPNTWCPLSVGRCRYHYYRGNRKRILGQLKSRILNVLFTSAETT